MLLITKFITSKINFFEKNKNTTINKTFILNRDCLDYIQHIHMFKY